MMKAGRRLVAAAACLGALTVWAEDWPTYRHDVRRSAHSRERLRAEILHETWVCRSMQPPQPAWAGPAKWDAYAGIRGLRSMRNYDPVFHPVVAGNSLFYGSTSDDAIHCLDTRSGKERWRFVTDGAVRVAPTYADGRLYVGSDDGHVYCLSPDRGGLIWKFRPETPAGEVIYNGRFVSFWPCRTGVMVEGGTAYFGNSLLPWKPSFLCAVDAATGRAEGPGRFVRQVEGVTFEGALLASRERIISPQGRVPPLLFRRDDGKPLGALEGGGGCFVLLTEDAHILHGPGNKTGWIQESGEEDRSTIATFNGGNALVVVGDKSFLLSDNALVAMDRTRKRELWTVPLDCPFALIAFDQHLVAGGTDKLAILRMSDGRLIWETSVEGRVHGLAVADKALFASTDTGAIHCYREGDSDRSGHGVAEIAAPTVDAAEPLDPVQPVEDDALLGRWVFQTPWVQGRVVKNLADGTRAQLAVPPSLLRLGSKEVLELDGSVQDIVIADSPTGSGSPVQTFTAEAWVRVDVPLSWGGIIGCIQDNGDFERGWLLGYVNSRFSLALAAEDGPGRMTYLQARSEFEAGQWYHVMGAYDGKEMKLYVDGRLEAQSTAQQGRISYPSEGVYVAGAYRDENEHYRLTGALREVRVYSRALSGGDAVAHAELFRHRLIKPPRYRVEVGPCLRFVGRDTATLWWESKQPTPTLLEYGLDEDDVHRIQDPKPKTRHEVILQVPKKDHTYRYRIGGEVEGQLAWTDDFECDTFFNFNPAAILPQSDTMGAKVRRSAENILASTGIRRGLCLLLGCQDPEIALALAAQSELRILVVNTDPEKTEAARQRFLTSGLHGVRLSARHVASWSELPFSSWFANLILWPDALNSGPYEIEGDLIARCLRPSGGVAFLGSPAGEVGRQGQRALLDALDEAMGQPGSFTSRSMSGWLRVERGSLSGAGEWSHQYGTAANSAYGGESLGGARGTADLEVQWIGRPGPRAQPDRNGRKPSPLARDGRLFVQGLQRVIAVDAFNGTVLWSLEIPPLRRFNLPRDCSNWCATDDAVFLAIGERCWRVGATSGVVDQTYPVVPGRREGWSYDWGFLSLQGERVIGSSTKQGSAFVEYWGGSDAGWYDAVSGAATHKVCSENLFALDRDSGRRLWLYDKGLVVNSTITIANGNMFFLENRHPKVTGGGSHRIGHQELWEELYLVAVDLEEGRAIWEQPVSPMPGIVAVYMAQSTDRLVLVTSGNGQYQVTCYGDRDGHKLWAEDFAWPSDNHGGHMARPAIVGSHVYVRPHTLDLYTGNTLELTVPGGGCGTYAGIDGGLVFRNSNVTLWNAASGAVSSWSRLRPDCWLSTIPAGGLLLSPEAGGGCSCGSWLETSIAFRPVGAR